MLADPRVVGWQPSWRYANSPSRLDVPSVSWELDPSPNPTGDERIHAHPWMWEELERQEEDLRMLEAAGVLGPDHLAVLRERSEAGGLRPVQRGLRSLE